MDQLDLAQLIDRCRTGDATALDTLVHTYQLPTYCLALSILDDPLEADEAVQDAFVIVWNKLDTYRGEAKFTSWLYAVTLNVCRGRLRKRRFRERLTHAWHAVWPAYDETVHPEQATILHEADSTLWQALQSLDAKLCEPLVLRYYHDLATADIARVVGVSERTIRTRLHTAHEQLRVKLVKGDY